MKVFLTGATGLVGSHTAQRLVQAGYQVTAMVRRLATEQAAFLDSLGVRLVIGDLGDSDAGLTRAMQGCGAVVHSAALVFREAGWDRYQEVNVRAVDRIGRAAAAAGAVRMVHVSSVAVYGGARGSPVSEEQWRERPIPPHAMYARSKREGEQAAWRLHEEGLTQLTVVRPVVVYGERDRLVVPRLGRAVRWPILPLPGDGRTALPVSYAGNVADAIVATLERTASIGRAYNLVEARPTTARVLLGAFARTLGRRARFVPVPGRLILATAAAGDAVAHRFPRFSRVELRRGARLLVEGVPYDGQRARQELGWSGRLGPEEAVTRAATWWRDVGARGMSGGGESRA
jgi:nucleoside-diphosphate-sugar epimerase